MADPTPYRDWKSLVNPEDIFASKSNLGYSVLHVENDKIFWTENHLAEKGRVVLVTLDENGKSSDITPVGYYIRSRVHEYGGRAFTIHQNWVYFVNFEDQRIYVQDLKDLSKKPRPITPEKNDDGSLGKYVALQISSDGSALICVYEKDFQSKENENYIAALNLETEKIQEPKILVGGNDFYGEPQISSDCKKIAWLTWNFPDMPWDSTELYIADFNKIELSLVSETIIKIAGGEKVSICQPSFDSHNVLHFVMDQAGFSDEDPQNWWNIYGYKDGVVEAITSELAEFGKPMWGLGNHQMYSYLSTGEIVAIYFKNGNYSLVRINTETKEISDISPINYTILNYIKVTSNDELIYFASSSNLAKVILKQNLETKKIEIVQPASDLPISEVDISIPEFIEYTTNDGEVSFAYLYLPKNSNYEKQSEDKPPLIVFVHGGPTANTSAEFQLRKQFWTSQGYAILDVDHRGSTGYGHRYRDKLLGTWGVIDQHDIRDGIKFLMKKGIVSDKIAITGGSAGGYAVQRALTLFPDLFKVGASYYGIGNLLTLVKYTHKFESKYLDKLIGIEEEIYNDRSPINHLDKLKSPMILFQGADDKVVIPENSREIAKILEEKGILHEYVEYEGEAHGFRTKEANVDSLTKEAAFFKKVLFNL